MKFSNKEERNKAFWIHGFSSGILENSWYYGSVFDFEKGDFPRIDVYTSPTEIIDEYNVFLNGKNLGKYSFSELINKINNDNTKLSDCFKSDML